MCRLSARPRANGTKLGRRRVEPAVEARILELKASGDGILKIGRKLGIGTSVVHGFSSRSCGLPNRRVGKVSLDTVIK